MEFNIGAVFHRTRRRDRHIPQAQFLIQPPMGTGRGVLLPMGMGAARIRPQPWRMVFAQRAALDQNAIPAQNEHRHGHMAQALLMRGQLTHGGQHPVHPCRDQIIHRPNPPVVRPALPLARTARNLQPPQRRTAALRHCPL